jgi:Serine/threonine protein phosphatase
VVLAVADGMGGMNGGERASRICVETLESTLREQHTRNSASWRAVLRDAVQRANLEYFSPGVAKFGHTGHGHPP